MLLVLLVFAIQVLSVTFFFLLVSASLLVEPILSWIQFSIWMREPCWVFCMVGLRTVHCWDPWGIPGRVFAENHRNPHCLGQDGRLRQGLALKCSLGDLEFSSHLTTYSREDLCSHGSKILSGVPFYENWIYEKHFFFISVNTKLH